MQARVRDLRDRTSRVIDALGPGVRATRTVRGEPVAAIVPPARRERWLAAV